MIEPVKYRRKPFVVEGMQVSPETIEDVTRWCGGTLIFKDAGNGKSVASHIQVKVLRPNNPKQSQAHMGDYVLRSERGFKIYTKENLAANFDLVRETSKYQVREDHDYGQHLEEEPRKVTIVAD